MATPLYLTGFEHQTPFTTNGGGLYSLVLGTWTADTSIKHSGNASAKVAVSSGAAADVRINKGLGAVTDVVMSVYINFGASLPGGSVVLPLLGTVNSPASNFPNLCYNPNTGFFGAQIGTLGRQEDNVTVQANTWYRIDFLSRIIGGTSQTLDIKVDGRAIAQASAASTTTNYATIYLGTTRTDHAVAFNVYYDDLMFNANAADYPLSGGLNYGVEGLNPSADGTHNAGTNIMEDQAGNDINGTTVTAWDKINSTPPDATTYIRQAATGTGNYVEVLFEDISATHSSIIGAMGCLAYTSATTTANRGACIISKDDFSSFTEIWGNPTTTQDYSDGATNNLFFKTAIISGAIDDTTVNALKARLGYSGDANPIPYWVDLMVEVAYTMGSPTDITLDLVTFSSTINALTVTENTVISLDLVTYNSTVNALTVVENVPVPLDLVTYSSTFNAIIVTENVIVPLDLVTYSITYPMLNILENTVIPLDRVNYTSTINAVTILENVIVSLDLVTYSSTIPSITITESVTISLDLVTYSSIVNDLEVLVQGEIFLDRVTYSSTILDIVILEQEIIPLDLVPFQSTINDISILTAETVFLDLVTYSSLVNPIQIVSPLDLITTPFERIYGIEIQIRVLPIDKEDRVLSINHESRIFSII